MKSSNLRQNLAQNIFFDTNSVGQLAKKPFPTEKINKNGTLSVSSQAKNISRTRSRRYITKISNFENTFQQVPFFKLRKSAHNDFLCSIPLLFENLEDIKVVFHNQIYIDFIFDTYKIDEALFFLDWIKTFAKMRQENRLFLMGKVILSNEDDFLRAFKLIKLQSIRAKQKDKNQKQKILNLILKYFPNEPFSTKEISKKVIIDRTNVTKILQILKEEKKLKKCRKKGAYLCFQVVKFKK